MRKVISLLLMELALILFSAPLRAEETGTSTSRFRLLSARAAATTYSQASMPFVAGSSYIFTGRAAWTPSYSLSSSMGLRGDLGVGFPRNVSGSFFFVANSEVFFDYRILEWMTAELGGGIQFWTDSSSIYPVATGGLVFPLKSRFLGVIDRIVADYSLAFTGTFLTHQIQLGIGI